MSVIKEQIFVITANWKFLINNLLSIERYVSQEHKHVKNVRKQLWKNKLIFIIQYVMVLKKCKFQVWVMGII